MTLFARALGLSLLTMVTSLAGCSGGEEEGTIPDRCSDPVPYIEGAESGLVLCSEGYVHREQKIACPDLRGEEGELEPVLTLDSYADWTEVPDEPLLDECAAHSECSEMQSCERRFDAGLELDLLKCVDGCVDDSDCADGFTCSCGEPIGTCVARGNEEECATDADCGGDALCVGIPYGQDCSGSIDLTFHCQTDADECSSHGDCDGLCAFVEGRFQCVGTALCE